MKVRFILLTIIASLTGTALFAQQPANVAQYPFTASQTTFNYLVGGTQITSWTSSWDDGYSSNIPIGFTFMLGGVGYTTVTANTNGVMHFGTNTTGYVNYPVTTSSLSSNVPCVMAGSHDASGSSTTATPVSYLTTGSPGSRIFTLEFRSWGSFSFATYPSYISYQYRLYESGVIELVYKQEGTLGFGANGSAVSIGIARTTTDWQTINNLSATPTSSSTVFTSGLSGKPATGQSYMWGVTSKGYNNASVNALSNPTYPFCPGSYTVTVKLKNTGKNQINGVKVGWLVDGVPQPTITYPGLIDTFGSTAGNTVTVPLNSLTFSGAPRQLQIYTTLPNNLADTVNNDDTLTMTLGPAPTSIITPVGTTIFCTAGVINATLNAPKGGTNTYQWKLNGSPIPGAIGSSFTATQAGDYSVTVDSNGCSNTSATTRVDNLAMPMPSVNPSGFPIMCNGDSITLVANAGVTGASYQWRFQGNPIPGATSSSYVVYNPGNYTVVTSKLVCNATSPGINIIPKPVPVPLITDTVINNAHVLMTDPSYSSYQWYISTPALPTPTPLTDDTLFVCVPKQNGDYTVIVNNGGCDGFSDTAHVNDIPTGGINNISGAYVRIYPNPAYNVFNIDAPAGSSVVLSGMDGKRVIEQPISKEGININTIPGGIYLIKILDRNGTVIKMDKLVKQNR